MRDDDHGKVCGAQHALEPLDAFQIQVIGRLIQHQHIGIKHHGFGNGKPLAPAPGEARRLIIHVHALSRGVDKSRTAQRLAQSLLAFVRGHPGGLKRRIDNLAHGDLRRKLRDLAHVADARPLAHGKLARVGVHFPGEHGKQRGFSCAIRTDQPDAVSIMNSERDVLKQWHGPKALRDTLSIQNRWHTPPV